MPSSQITFYMMPEDVAELDQYIKEQGLLIVAYSNSENKPLIIDSILNLKELKAYFILPENLHLVKMNYYETRNIYIAQESFAPFIEYRCPVFLSDENKMRTGRLYFDKEMYNDKKELISKDEKTLKLAEDLLKWYRKHFQNIKINPHLTTIRVGKFVKSTNVELKIN